jgi:hypothetical protein
MIQPETPTVRKPKFEEGQASEPHLARGPASARRHLTVGRRGQVALFGLNRPQIQNRIDPDAFRALATAYYDYDHDPSLRAAWRCGPRSVNSEQGSRPGALLTSSKCTPHPIRQGADASDKEAHRPIQNIGEGY